MNFDELNDEIGADHWLIPRQELASRRVIKRTARYTIYKADWFGDVLVYEPFNGASRNATDEASRREELAASRGQTQRCNSSEQEDLRRRLCINMNAISSSSSTSSTPQATHGHDYQVDSAYSSISSSPQFHNNKKREFQFPEAAQSILSCQPHPQPQPQPQPQQEPVSQEVCSDSDACSALSSSDMSDCASSADFSELESMEADEPIGNACQSPPVILNKDSFSFGRGAETLADTEAFEQSTSCASSPSATWFELNELRLVAHENFILFMGASMDDAQSSPLHGECNRQSTSLVMEMIKPKSVSLFNLLHASRTQAPASSLNRFFAFTCRQQSPFLGQADKLNICQQVTNAMTYLHDKNIVHGRLTSVNIYIETNQRVKISLIDNDEQPVASCSDESGEPGRATAARSKFNLPTLTYLSPEIVRTIKVEGRQRGDTCSKLDAQGRRHTRVGIDSGRLTKQADVYSFGTLLFELFEERFPFAHVDSPHQCDATTTTTTTVAAAAHRSSPRRSPSPTPLSTSNNNNTKLFDTLCLANHSPSATRSSPGFSQTGHHQTSTPLCTTADRHSNGSIKFSASELIFLIGSGQTSHRNQHRHKCPALVDHIISACWSAEPACRPNFKQIRFE